MSRVQIYKPRKTQSLQNEKYYQKKRKKKNKKQKENAVKIDPAGKIEKWRQHSGQRAESNHEKHLYENKMGNENPFQFE